MLMYNKDYPDAEELHFYTCVLTVKDGLVEVPEGDLHAQRYLKGLGFVQVRRKQEEPSGDEEEKPPKAVTPKKKRKPPTPKGAKK